MKLLSIKRVIVIIWLLLFLPVVVCASATLTGKVVSVADGDTITVLQDRQQYKIRLYGVDAPENKQDFGRKAKQFLTDKVAGKAVTVVVFDKDRYGRSVGLVYGGCIAESVNEQLLKAGYAWVYKRYCKRTECDRWTGLETKAKENHIGLWQQKNPVPPWEYRYGNKRGSREAPSKSYVSAMAVLHGNVRSHIFHRQGCRYYNCKNCVVSFSSRHAAADAGFRACKMCKP